MFWSCSNCGRRVTRPDRDNDKICCPLCGKVLYEDNFSEEHTFVKDASGQSQVAGNIVKSVQNDLARIEKEAKAAIDIMIEALGIAKDAAGPALRLHKKAFECNFTKGRRKDQVQAACLYISCRVLEKPYLLIDFSDYLRINVYELGAVYLQLCKKLSLEKHPVFLRLVDPSLFIHRFTERLFGDNKRVTRTALHIVASMKRDWMQTGRKPSGLCGAAIYISALSHGLKCSKSDIIKAVHICEATLTKRLIEFENTESGGLTIEEFNMKANEFDEDKRLIDSLKKGEKIYGISDLCVHDSEKLAYGLCERCYEAFIKLFGGLNGGSEPPAFQLAEKERIMAKEAAADSSENLGSSTLPGPAERNCRLLKSDEQRSIKNVSEHEVIQPADYDSTGATVLEKIIHDSENDRVHADEDTFEVSESLSDIDDIEVDVYLHSEEEKQLKKIIWEDINKEYVEEQAAKEAAAIAAKKASEASFSNCSEDVQAAQELAAAAAVAVANSKKERQQKRAAGTKNSGPPQSAAEATKQMLDRKRLSSKIRYDVLEKLFDEPEIPESNKKSRTEAESDHDNNYLNNSKEDHELEGTEDTYIDNMEEYDYGDDYDHFDDYNNG